ncbi:putative uncharacterized protein [Waddlia chondrophila 2032/99]|uniref:HNH nuclease domain-containing protein n=1 Tax=Waddlia chondrophila 2032/99 TaxID=765953 RepID=F8LCT1_9BACT|nr:putative uncharacterized protein [Waddlia chondrophila 2032/99]
MTTISVQDDFERQIICSYEGEQYSVRDNGAIMRHVREGKCLRKDDNQWTFGKPNSQNGYMFIGKVRVHRIVASAFHGESPTSQHVVDHIDTNRRNNRPENLRWLTKLENALCNPITRARIEFRCGSIEAFLEDPSLLQNQNLEPDLKWMRTVTPEEAENCKARLAFLVKSNRNTKNSHAHVNQKRTVEKRIYKPLQKWEVGLAGEPGLEMALTPWCAQYMWRASAYFPCCPDSFGVDPVEDYFRNIKNGAVLAYSDESDLCPKFIVCKARLLKKRSSIVVLCKRGNAKWSIIGIELHKSSQHFIHYVLGTHDVKDDSCREFASKNEQTDFYSEGYASAFL